MRTLKNQQGFTVVELMIVAALSLIIAYGIFTAISTGNDQIRTADLKMNIQDSAREGIYRMVQEMRLSAPDRIWPNGTTIEFVIPDGANPLAVDYKVDWNLGHRIRYALGGVNNTQIIRTDLLTGQTSVIANDVVNLGFQGNGANPTVVTVTVGVQRALGNGRLVPAQPLQITGQAEIRNPRA